MLKIKFNILSFTNHLIIQQKVNIIQINSYINEIVLN